MLAEPKRRVLKAVDAFATVAGADDGDDERGRTVQELVC